MTGVSGGGLYSRTLSVWLTYAAPPGSCGPVAVIVAMRWSICCVFSSDSLERDASYMPWRCQSGP